MPKRDNSADVDPDRIKALMAELAASGPLSIKRVASQLDRSPRTLQRELARRGLSFRTILAEVRLDVARVLLVMTDLQVTEIAQRLGYGSPASFTRAFSRWTGQSPRTFRRATPRPQDAAQ